MNSRRQEREKRFGLSDPAVWDAINRSLTQQRHLSSLNGSGERFPKPLRRRRRPRVPSRTSSQHRTLNRFTRQLEKYADAVDAKGKPPIVTPTESESKLSLHTVKPLLPYHKEFQSAGLAVTSSEQIHKSPARLTTQAQQPGNDTQQNVLPEVGSKLDGQNDTVHDSDSTSTGSYLLFTDPNDLSAYLIDPLPESKSRSKPKSGCSEGFKLPWFKAKPTMAKPSEDQYDLKQPNKLVKGGRVDDKPRVEVEKSKPPVSKVPATRRGTRTTRHSKSTLARRPDSRCRHSTHVASTKQPLPESEKRKSYPQESASPPKSSYVEVPSTQPKESVHQRCRKLEATLSKRESSSIQPPPKHPLHGKRVMANRPLPHPKAIREETEPSTEHLAPCPSKQAYPARPTGKRKPTTVAHEEQQKISPQTNISPVSSLPYVARIAATTESSLERALDAVMEKLDEMETQPSQQTHQPSTATLLERTNHSKPPPASSRIPDKENVSNEVTIWPLPPSNTVAETRKLSRRPSIGQPPKAPAPEPTRNLLSQPLLPIQEGSPSKGKGPATTSREKPSVKRKSLAPGTQAAPPGNTEQVLDDLDVFFNHDDATINDKDVLQGLQVAVHAAADDFYDAYIRYKTGMRIRRFLADLKSVDLLERENLLDQVSKERREEFVRRRQTGS